MVIFNAKAELSREASGSSNIERTLEKAVKVLALFKYLTTYAAALRFKSTVILVLPWMSISLSPTCRLCAKSSL